MFGLKRKERQLRIGRGTTSSMRGFEPAHLVSRRTQGTLRVCARHRVVRVRSPARVPPHGCAPLREKALGPRQSPGFLLESARAPPPWFLRPSLRTKGGAPLSFGSRKRANAFYRSNTRRANRQTRSHGVRVEGVRAGDSSEGTKRLRCTFC